MEGAFRQPSAALLSGYGGDPIVFKRQGTKRLWYTAYAVLRALVDLDKRGKSNRGDGYNGDKWNEGLLKELLSTTILDLIDAPCH